ncbi:uncharacterized protein isoform X2 [Musca autumnalis]|uniref:uncharacterized protein isoform X2 n=1 Tax=Musca autumnalis TaxID=221902 RepID=UPI003CE76F30
MDFQRMRIKSLDNDDVFSSGRSYGQDNMSFNSDSDYSGAVSVRDMIRHYDGNAKKDKSNAPNSHNSAMRRQSYTSLHNRTPSFSGLVTPVLPRSQTNLLFPHQQGGCIENISGGVNNINGSCCKNCVACNCCQNRNLKSLAAIQKFQTNEIIHHNLHRNDVVAKGNSSQTDIQKTLEYNKKAELVAISSSSPSAPPPPQPPNALQTVIPNKNHLYLSNDSIEKATCHPIETSYQSKTTIAKTATGVRIIIDIFFDPEQQCVNTSDILGSRVETDIPQSRILDEFQQQINAAAVTVNKTTPATTTRRN